MMTALHAAQERAAYIEGARTLFRDARLHCRVIVSDDGNHVWKDPQEAQRWANQHAAADAIVKRYYAQLKDSNR